MAPIDTKVTSARPDLTLFRFGMEFGAAECGKEDKAGVGKKEIVESNLRCPKILKSMLLHIGFKCDNDKDVIRSLKIIGVSQFRKYSLSMILFFCEIYEMWS